MRMLSTKPLIHLFVSSLLLLGFVAPVVSSPPSVLEEQGYTSKVIEMNGLNFHYLEKGEGQPILFLHGFPFDSETWLPVMEPLSNSNKVVALDNRGYPRSDKPADISAYDIRNLVADVSAFMAANFADQKVILVGHDWGATLAWTVAQKHPEQVAKLVAINAPPYNVFLKMMAENETQQAASVYIPRLKSAEFEKVLVDNGAASVWGFGFNTLHESGAIDDAFKDRYFAAWNEKGAIRGGINWYRANIPDAEKITEDDYWPSKEERVEVPSLLLWSDGEAAFVKDTFEEIKKYVDDLHVEIIENAGHLVQLEHSAIVTDHIKAFVSSEEK